MIRRALVGWLLPVAWLLPVVVHRCGAASSRISRRALPRRHRLILRTSLPSTAWSSSSPMTAREADSSGPLMAVPPARGSSCRAWPATRPWRPPCSPALETSRTSSRRTPARAPNSGGATGAQRGPAASQTSGPARPMRTSRDSRAGEASLSSRRMTASTDSSCGGRRGAKWARASWQTPWTAGISPTAASRG